MKRRGADSCPQSSYCNPAKFIIAMVLISAIPAPSLGDSFDWRNYGGEDFTTPVRDQWNCGSCWAFGACAAVEAKLDITAGDPNLSPNLSEQHLIYDDNGGGDCNGGLHSSALSFIKNTGIVSESILPYQADDDYSNDPNWPLPAGWENQAYTIDSYAAVVDYNSDGVLNETDDYQGALEDYGPLVIAIFNKLLYKEPPNQSSPPYSEINAHSVCVVGYEDDESLDEGGFWIVKNSWGAGWGDNGYGYLLYGDESSVYAVTGDASQAPEPASIFLLALGACTVVRKRRPRNLDL